MFGEQTFAQLRTGFRLLPAIDREEETTNRVRK